MKLVLLIVGFLASSGYAMAQYDYPQSAYPQPIYPPGYNQRISLPPPPTTTVVNQPQNQTVVQTPPSPIVPPVESFASGWRESWVHEFRPIKDYPVTVVPTTLETSGWHGVNDYPTNQQNMILQNQIYNTMPQQFYTVPQYRPTYYAQPQVYSQNSCYVTPTYYRPRCVWPW
jgi:hypothetical protein